MKTNFWIKKSKLYKKFIQKEKMKNHPTTFLCCGRLDVAGRGCFVWFYAIKKIIIPKVPAFIACQVVPEIWFKVIFFLNIWSYHTVSKEAYDTLKSIIFKATVWCNQIETVFPEMSSWTALTGHFGINTTV